MKRLTSTVILIAVLLSCNFPNKEKDHEPDIEQLWEIALEVGNIDGIKKSLLVSVNEEIVIEYYYNAHQNNTTHDVRSVIKSYLATLVGIAID